MIYQVTGKVITVLPKTEGVSQAGKPWVKIDFVINTEEQYPKTMSFTGFNDKADAIIGLNPGDSVTVDFIVESKEYNGKWYTNLSAWKIVKTGATLTQQIQPAKASATNALQVSEPDLDLNSSRDDLPF